MLPGKGPNAPSIFNHPSSSPLSSDDEEEEDAVEERRFALPSFSFSTSFNNGIGDRYAPGGSN